MDTSEIIQRLRDLQIEQNKLFRELDRRYKQPKSEPTDQPAENPGDRNTPPAATEGLEVGDTIVLLMNGLRCKKGDKAKVVRITDSAVHFTVLKNGHSTYKKPKNVRKV